MPPRHAAGWADFSAYVAQASPAGVDEAILDEWQLYLARHLPPEAASLFVTADTVCGLRAFHVANEASCLARVLSISLPGAKQKLQENQSLGATPVAAGWMWIALARVLCGMAIMLPLPRSNVNISPTRKTFTIQST